MTDRRPSGGQAARVGDDLRPGGTSTSASTARRLAVVGVSYRSAPVELRERLAVGVSELGAFAARLAAGGEAVVLATCGRTEVYLADCDPSGARAHAAAVLASRAGLSPDELEHALYALDDEEVVLHLFRVAAGLESLVPGESEILGQVRDAHRVARATGVEGPLLDRLFSQALRTGKRVRAETAPSAQPASLAEAATQLARRHFDELAERRILIIGAGKMSELAAASFVFAGAPNVCVANRTLARGEALARRFGGQAVGLERVVEELEQSDVVVSSTRSFRLVLTVDEVADVLTRRNGRPLLMIDIAVPRDIDPRIGDLEGCYLHDIDDLGEIAHADAREAEAESARAEAIVAEETERFCGWLRALEVGPTIISLRRKGEEIRAAELARADRKLRTLSPAERRAVEMLTTRIVNKLLHSPTVGVKEAAARADGALQRTSLRHLFELEEGRA